MAPLNPYRVGDVLADKYRLERLLGTGGMGVVFAATHLELDRCVAIKLLRPDQSDNAGAVARFLLEARATARLNGPHVAKVLDVGRIEGQTPFIVMELLEGQNLQSLIQDRGPLSSAQAVDCVLEACEAVVEAHRAGILHRDLKPANLFLTRDAYGDPSIKVLDFGISKLLEPREQDPIALTDSRTLVGSPAYMSPEQMRSARDVDHRTDIWGLGTVLFELLTGRPVWTGQSLSELCAQVARDPCPKISELCPGIAQELSAVVERCLEKDPRARYQQVSDLALALARFAGTRGQAASNRVLQMAGPRSGAEGATTKAPSPSADLDPQSTAGAMPATALTRFGRRAQRRVGSLLGVLALLVVSVILFASLHKTKLSEPTPAATTISPAAAVASMGSEVQHTAPSGASSTTTPATVQAIPIAATPSVPAVSIALNRPRVTHNARQPAAKETPSAAPYVEPRGGRKPTTTPDADPMSIRNTAPRTAADPMSIRK